MRRRIFFRTAIVWFLIAAIWEACRIWVVLHGPSSPELYTNSLSFQLIASLFSLVVQWLPILAGVILLEVVGFMLVGRVRSGR